MGKNSLWKCLAKTKKKSLLTLAFYCSVLQWESTVYWSKSRHSYQVFRRLFLTGWHGTVALFHHTLFPQKSSSAHSPLCSLSHLKQKVLHQVSVLQHLLNNTFALKRWKQASEKQLLVSEIKQLEVQHYYSFFMQPRPVWI